MFGIFGNKPIHKKVYCFQIKELNQAQKELDQNESISLVCLKILVLS